MGAIWAHKLPEYLDRWGVAYVLEDGWYDRSRSSGGWDALMGIGIHHDASSLTSTPYSSFRWACYNSPDEPIGNGLLDRGGVFHFWAAGAANTQGRGGPVLSSRGVVPLDSGNRRMFSIEADNNGIGERWTPDQDAAYPLLCAAIIDWANNETPGAKLGAGDIWAHFEWTNPENPYGPSRKIDPLGPSKFSNFQVRKWDMDSFRGAVLQHLLKGPVNSVPEPSQPAPPKPTPKVVPNPPRSPEMIATANGTTLVGWDTPDKLGTHPLVDYVIQVEMRQNPGTWVSVPNARVTADRARIATHNDAEYRFRILARSAAGASGWATSAYFKTFQVPVVAPAPAPATPVEPASTVIGALDMAFLARESGSDTIWFTPNGGITRHGIRSLDQLELIILGGAINAKTGVQVVARGRNESWKGIGVLTTAELNDRLGPAA